VRARRRFQIPIVPGFVLGTLGTSVFRLFVRCQRLEATASEFRPGLPSRLAFPRELHHLMVMIDWSQCAAVERVPGRVGGAWLFKNTRVPVKAFFENIEGGATVDEFLAWFPGVERAQVDAVLGHAQRSLELA